MATARIVAIHLRIEQGLAMGGAISPLHIGLQCVYRNKQPFPYKKIGQNKKENKLHLHFADGAL